MADSTVVPVDPTPSHQPPFLTGDFDPCLHNPPLDAAFFAEHHLLIGGGAANDEENDGFEGLDFDFSFDGLCFPVSDDLDYLLEPTLTPMQQSDSQSGSDLFSPNFGRFQSVFKSASLELGLLPGDGDFPDDQAWEGSGVLSSSYPEIESQQISGYLNMPSPESNGSNRDSTENCGGDADREVLKCNSPESEGSRDFVSNVSEDKCAIRSVIDSPNSSNSSIRTGVVDQKIKLEERTNNNVTTTSLKRKNESEDLEYNDIDSRTNKYRKSNCSLENDSVCGNSNGVSNEEEEKRKARLLRNRESAQLSRQRKKHYVEELEDKVRTMHSTIQDLNAKITYFMAENATLRHQMGGGGSGGTTASPPGAPPPSRTPSPPGVYPHLAMMYPWMPCPPPYMVKQQGSQVPLVPIPRLKAKQPAQAQKTSKKADRKKNEEPKTKKVASISFLGLLFFMMLFGGLVPMFNMRYGGIREAFTGKDGYIASGFVEKHHGRVLIVNGSEYGEKHGNYRDASGNSSKHGAQRGRPSGVDPGADEFVRLGNGSEPLAASLYVPRNDRLVKIDGNLIIHSVLATEKATASHGKGGTETGLIVPRDLAHARPVQGMEMNGARHPQLRALGSSSGDKDGMKSTATDRSLQQWFREGLAGPMLSSGLCTEVFQFDVAAAGAIIPAAAAATTAQNLTEANTQNSTNPNMARNRRILEQPSPRNISAGQPRAGRNPEKENLDRNKNTSSMVVSVLFDPREAGDAEVDGVMGTKSLSRIFVVVLIDSVKYVTYSCMLPFAGSGPHLVAA